MLYHARRLQAKQSLAISAVARATAAATSGPPS